MRRAPSWRLVHSCAIVYNEMRRIVSHTIQRNAPDAFATWRHQGVSQPTEPIAMPDLPTRYLDFDLEIGPGEGRTYPVSVLHSPAGEARTVMQFPFDELALENYLLKLQTALLRSGGRRRSILDPHQQAVQDFGRALFEALFNGEVRSRYDLSRLQADHAGPGAASQAAYSTT